MLRLTTNVTSSPASSARSSSAAWRMSSIASGRVSANSAVSSSGVSAAPSTGARDRARDAVGTQRSRRLRAPAAAPRDEAPVARLDDVEHALRDPFGVDVARVDAEALGQREALRREPLAHLVRRRERVLGRDVVAVGAEAAEIRRAGGDELRPPVGEVRRHLHADVGHQPAALADQPLHLVDRDRRGPRRQLAVRRVADPGRPAPPRGQRRRSRPARGRSSCRAGRSSAGSPPAGGRARRGRRRAPRAPRRARPRVSPMPTRIPLVNGIRSSPAARIVSSRRCGCFVGEP